MKITRRKRIALVAIATIVLGFPQSTKAQVIVHNLTHKSGQWSSQVQGSSLYLYSDPQPYPSYWDNSSGLSTVITVQNRNQPTTVILLPNRNPNRILLTPVTRPGSAVIYTNSPRQCGTAIMGSPIPSVVPVDLYGHPCR